MGALSVSGHGRRLCGALAVLGASGLAAAAPLAERATARPEALPAAPPEPLPVDEAFAFTSWLDGDRLVAHWNMPQGYYLYRHRFAVRAGEGVTLGKPVIPPGEAKTDAHFGETEVHYGNVAVTVPVIAPAGEAAVAARITYQGCAASGLCYPPQVRLVAHRRERKASAGNADPVGKAEVSAAPVGRQDGR